MGRTSGTETPVDELRRRLQLGGKRVLDATISIVALLLLAIPFAIIAISIKLDSKGPVFFRQERAGKSGRHFRVFKFRTMVVGAECMGYGYTVVRADPRITRVGRLLRDSGLDELPQLINVLKGEMSLVGPRPTLLYQVAQYTPYQRRRLTVKPGITGWAVVRGRRNLTWGERIELDIWYIDNWSLALDCRILVRTLKCVLVDREGLYSDTQVGDFGSGEEHIASKEADDERTHN